MFCVGLRPSSDNRWRLLVCKGRIGNVVARGARFVWAIGELVCEIFGELLIAWGTELLGADRFFFGTAVGAGRSFSLVGSCSNNPLNHDVSGNLLRLHLVAYLQGK